jgi:hypothetical protein
MNLANQKPKDTYKGILTLTDNAGLTTTLKAVGDGNGGYSPLQLSTQRAAILQTGSGSSLWILHNSTNGGIRGYRDTGSAPAANQSMFEIGVMGYDGTTYVDFRRSAIRFIATETWTSTANGSDIRFQITPNTTISGNVAMTIKNSGDVVVASNSDGITASARLHVRGVAGSSVTFFEPTSGGSYQTINSNFHFVHYHTTNFVGVETFRILNGASITPSGSGIYRGVQIYETGFSPSAGNSSFRPFNIEYTLSASGVNTATATGIFLNATETALNGMGHNLMDLQVGGVSRFRGTNAGALVLASGLTAVDNILTSSGDIQASGVSAEVKFGSRIRLSASADGVMLVRNNAGTDFNRLQFGGTTNAFPAIKRNSAAIEFVTADGAANSFVDIVARQYTSYYGAASGFQIHSSAATALTGFTIQSYNTTLGGKILTLYSTSIFEADATAGGGVTLRGSGDTHTAEASALFAMKSITKGFLPPRMTDTEVRAITTPAEGLVVFNTTISHLCIFASNSWHKLNYSGM